MTAIPVITVFMTDFGTITLSDDFVREATRRWPGKRIDHVVDRETGEDIPRKVPLWEDALREPINAAAKDHYLRGPEHDLTRLDSVEELAPWMESA